MRDYRTLDFMKKAAAHSPKSVTSRKPVPPNTLLQLLQKYWQVLVFCVGAAALRFYNFQQSLYFIYDQGRDAWVLERLAHGKVILTGPTSGLAGFFLGPLWYYVGLPGYFLGAGNPYVICLWYMALACIALPLSWILAHKLFADKRWAVLTAVLLATVPGSIHASIFIWNPLLAAPLMLASFLSFLKARASRSWLFLAFLFLALTLQSEFAYAIFFLLPVFMLIPWIRRKFDLRDFGNALAAIIVTGLPQLFFDLRHQFLMTTSLLKAMTDQSQSVPWADHLANRPTQLLNVSLDLLISGAPRPSWLGFFLVVLCGLGILLALIGLRNASPATKNPTSDTTADRVFVWRLLTIFALIPYPFFILWRGNHGFFFDYYLTCHFLFLIPLIVRGAQQLLEWSRKFWLSQTVVGLALIVLLYLSARYSVDHWNNTVRDPHNNGGLTPIVASAETIYGWQTNTAQPPVVTTFTSNIYIDQYDYVFHWYARAHHLPEPRTVRNPEDQHWFVVTQHKSSADPYFYQPWYYEATKSGQLKREEQVGVMTIEEWEK